MNYGLFNHHHPYGIIPDVQYLRLFFERADEQFLHSIRVNRWSLAMILTIELSVALPNRVTVLVGRVPYLRAIKAAAILADQLC